MDNAKTWYESKAVWGGLIALFASILQARGHLFPYEQQAALVDALTSAGGAFGALLAIYGRLAATKPIVGS
ncbi:hypothetical protein MUU53_06670 [Rhizobium lemnae]|uniref:Holin n=1 Tax=Rhizobium lemnae TaxID=1214924 RepID=A0ABV8E2K4_9HYPH|nr:hypothetical protein [Rhizobium lemnae]MCJ8507596.1 hypothetical protein [Rhizobium lemnae]